MTQCSGGERQRVALARALAYDPEILFFDEPLSAIDYKLRKTLEKELKDIHRETHKTFIYITHSLEEAMVMSDRIGVMRDGRLVQVGTPNEIYTAPQTKFVSEFMGDVNIIARERGAPTASCRPTDFDATFRGPRPANGMTAGHLVIRPEFVRFLSSPVGGRQQPRRPALQRICAGLAHPVPGARRRAGLHRRKTAPAGLFRPASTTIVTHRLGRRRLRSW